MTNESATLKTRTEEAGRDSKQLLACPFCGGEAAHNTARYSDEDIIRLNGQDEFYGVNCISCGTNNRGLIGHKTPDAAADHWNRRAG